MRHKPISTIFICLSTLIVSLIVAYLINGTIFGTTKILHMEAYGGVTLDHIKRFELWRLLVAQLIHSKQIHMLYNVIALVMLGVYLEKYIGTKWFVSVWFVAGALGTLYSTLFVMPPWDIGTGGSQAVFGVAGMVLVLLASMPTKKYLSCALIFALVPATIVDLFYTGYPKPGHLAGLTIGLLSGLIYTNFQYKYSE